MILRMIALCCVFAALASPVLAGGPELAVGSDAPQLELTAADGSRISLGAVAGPTVLIFYRGLW